MSGARSKSGPKDRAATRCRHNIAVADLKKKIDDLSGLMDEFGLDRADLRGEGWSVGFDRNAPNEPKQASAAPVVTPSPKRPKKAGAFAAPKGMPVSSPMTGIYYSAPSPGAPPFCKEGESVTAGQVVGLIEAMKVFNEITAPTSGTVTAIRAKSGQLVQPGDPLLYIG